MGIINDYIIICWMFMFINDITMYHIEILTCFVNHCCLFCSFDDDDMDKHNNIDIDNNNSAPTSGDGYKHNPNGQRRRMSPPKLPIIETSNRSHLSVHDAMNKRPKCQRASTM